MYQRYAEVQCLRFEIIDASEIETGGYKEASAQISGTGVFARLKFESGAHRVQRVPVTEGSGRIPTSAATVPVLPEAEEVDAHIRDKTLWADNYRHQGARGTHDHHTDPARRTTPY